MKGTVMMKSVTNKRVVVTYKTEYGEEVTLTAGFTDARHFDEDVCNRIILSKIEAIDMEVTYENM